MAPWGKKSGTTGRKSKEVGAKCRRRRNAQEEDRFREEERFNKIKAERAAKDGAGEEGAGAPKGEDQSSKQHGAAGKAAFEASRGIAKRQPIPKPSGSMFAVLATQKRKTPVKTAPPE
mmetsp:Transcript_37500/g.88700  ORF Transcript_37500/g.88700 Transcript_37500/m.88700 type:complete len:118 (-) Transcript_37500:32-385(-)